MKIVAALMKVLKEAVSKILSKSPKTKSTQITKVISKL
jgi:hypothetical protein